MSTAEGDQPEKPRRVRRGQQPTPPVNVKPPKYPTPTARLDALTQDLVQALEDDKERHLAQIEQLQARIDQLGPENARLREALDNTEANNIISAILIALGGFIVSFASLAGEAATAWAGAAAVILLAGIVTMMWPSVVRRVRRS